jgi:N-acetylglucosamine kinase-like BadF-type ATPase
MIMERINARIPYQLIEWVYGLDENLRRTEIAKMAVLVYEAAKKGDEKAMKILEKAAFELYECVEAAIRIMKFEKNIISYSGSVLEKNEIVHSLFEKLVKNKFDDADIHRAVLPPVLGGVILGMKKLKIEINEDIVERLKSSF